MSRSNLKFPLSVTLCDGYDWDNRSTVNSCTRVFNTQQELDWAKYRRSQMPRVYNSDNHGYQNKTRPLSVKKDKVVKSKSKHVQKNNHEEDGVDTTSVFVDPFSEYSNNN